MPTVHGWSWERIITGYSWYFKVLPWRRILTSCLFMMGHPAPGTCGQGKPSKFITCGSVWFQPWQTMNWCLHYAISTWLHPLLSLSQNWRCIIKREEKGKKIVLLVHLEQIVWWLMSPWLCDIIQGDSHDLFIYCFPKLTLGCEH